MHCTKEIIPGDLYEISYLDFNIHDIAVRAPFNIAISGWICDVCGDVLCCKHGRIAILHVC